MKIDRQNIYNKHNGHCGYCGSEISYKEMQVDHIIPQAFWEHHLKNKFRIPTFLQHLNETDLNHIDNLMPTCRVCNKWKSAHHLELFRSEIAEQVKRLNDYSSNYRMAKKYGLVTEKDIDIKFYFETNPNQ